MWIISCRQAGVIVDVKLSACYDSWFMWIISCRQAGVIVDVKLSVCYDSWFMWIICKFGMILSVCGSCHVDRQVL